MQKRPVKLLKFLAAIVGIALLAACSGDDDTLTDSTVTPPPSVSKNPTPGENVTPVLPEKDFRAVWMATVDHIDWPNSMGSTSRVAESQKKYYLRYLDSLQALNINAVMFQVRPMADAFYDSPYEPWSKYITGRRGNKPSYDPLSWLISETHKRGIQFHAWINPYRIATRSGASASFPTLESTIPAGQTHQIELPVNSLSK